MNLSAVTTNAMELFLILFGGTLLSFGLFHLDNLANQKE
ncbi:hypothetical protein LEP1GSC191_4217 [Leptospira borgpetersenii serovar Mini str. 201000851]|uniref:Uncharacterized protein n=2 Tax=Leptospira borgpetersenii TaxID=174 RepID=M3F713_LEPBO|nr:hypothetical protein LEP1GSC128_0991 [Leptospira borgpetersenii str. 200801926]EMF97762.1 hypothetical protein LEP1GSC123_0931 [Leptospira borgpetersenii str. 200701203]EMK10131.1 hypothetical protein LEP1GSC066_0720 [Leptospira sp. serovar Kenya str. Sh9]ENO62940.1 hypothetical protein LEP1GSC191_4217 [Leptospira borgpetersenii serovar Mini str. 201000851]